MMEVAAAGSSKLSAVLIEKAEKELGEKPEWRDRDIQALRDLVTADKSLYCPHEDDAFLLMFLRARKFDYDRAYQLIKQYYQARLDHPDFYKAFRPSYALSKYKAGVMMRLPQGKETDPATIYVDIGQWKPSEDPDGMDGIFKANFMQIEQVIREEAVQVNGIRLFMNIQNLSWDIAKNMGPFYAKKVMGLLQNCMPCRLKAIHYIFVPSFFETIFLMVKPFLSEKLQQRVNFHHTPDYLKESGEEMSNIPECLGGTLDLEKHIEEWAAYMESCEEEFIAREKYGIKEISTVRDTSNSADPVGGITGTFRKLYCD